MTQRKREPVPDWDVFYAMYATRLMRVVEVMMAEIDEAEGLQKDARCPRLIANPAVLRADLDEIFGRCAGLASRVLVGCEFQGRFGKHDA